MTEIRPEDLRAQDLDTPPAGLQFMVTPASNGHLALKSAPMRAALNFTQEHIDQGQLLFVHKGNNQVSSTPEAELISQHCRSQKHVQRSSPQITKLNTTETINITTERII